jgi:hypothetical protein
VEDIELAVALDRLGNHPFDIGGIRYIGRADHAVAALFFDGFLQLSGPLFRTVDEDNLCPLPGKQNGGRRAVADSLRLRRGACHYRHFTCQSSFLHDGLP